MERRRNISYTTERDAADLLITNSQKGNTVNTYIDALACGDRIDVGTTARTCVPGPPPLYTENRAKTISTGPSLLDSGLDSWEQHLVIPSYDMFCTYLEIQRVFSTARNATNIPPHPTSTPDSSLERKQKPKESPQSYETDSNSTARRSRTPIASSGFPPARDQGIGHVKNQVMVQVKPNKSRIIWEEEMRSYPQTKPKATPPKQRDHRALDQKPNVEKNQHFSNGVEHLNSPESNRKTSMVEIRVDNGVFFADRGVLSKYSSYFANLFSKRLEQHRLPMTIRVSGISSGVFRVFLDFLYGINVTLNSINYLDELIKMADAFSTPVLKQHCLNLLDKVSLEYAVQILRDKQHPPSSRLFSFLVSRISEEFPKVYDTVRFYELDVSIVCRILSSDNIQIATETEVLQVALKWIGYSINERRQYLSRLMRCVRFHCMTQDQLFECLEITEWLKECFEIKNILMEANWLITARLLGRNDPFDVPASAERTCFRGRYPHLKKKSSAFFGAQIFPDVRVGIEAFHSPQKTTAKAHNQGTATAQKTTAKTQNQGTATAQKTTAKTHNQGSATAQKTKAKTQNQGTAIAQKTTAKTQNQGTATAQKTMAKTQVTATAQKTTAKTQNQGTAKAKKCTAKRENKGTAQKISDFYGKQERRKQFENKQVGGRTRYYEL